MREIEPIDVEMQQALAHHSAQRLLEAEQAYRSILQAIPDHPDANHNLGLLSVQMNQPVAGLPFFKAAVEAAPERDEFWAVYVDALMLTDRADEAREVIEQARRRQGQPGQVRLQNPDARAPAASGAGLSDPDSATLASEFIATLLALAGQGLYSNVETLARQMTALLPDHGFGWKALADALLHQGRAEDAMEPLRQAAALLPDDRELQDHAEALTKLHEAIGRHRRGHLDESEALYRAVLKVQPANPDANHNLGVLLAQTARHDAALPYFEAALGIHPNQGQYWATYINALVMAGQKSAAQLALGLARQRGLKGPVVETLTLLISGEMPQQMETAARPASKPGRAAVAVPPPQQIKQVVSLFNAGRHKETVEAARKLTQRFPEYGLGWKALGCALHQLRLSEEALAPLQRAVDLEPDDFDALQSLADIYRHRSEFAKAEVACRRLLELRPDFAEGHRLLGMILGGRGQHTEAETRCRRALELMPGLPLAHGSLGSILLEQGRLAEAEACFRHAMLLAPDNPSAYTSLLFCMSHSEHTEPAALFAEHRRFGQLFEEKTQNQRRPHLNPRDPERHLQIGFVSGDLLGHAVASFFEPVLTHLARDENLTLHAYYNFSKEDAVTARLRPLFDHWHAVVDLNDDELAKQVRADGIDILIDLSGHTDRNRLLAFARKPAPVQASWIGYPGTTGLTTIDYYLADRYFIPHEFGTQFTEKLVHLPAIAPFMPDTASPPINALPALQNGHVTFGSFNRLNKLRREVIALWSELLRAVPGSRLLLAGMPQNGNVGELVEWFAADGISRDRLDFRPRSSMQVYLEQHHRVDICVDTFPYAGGTTTLHSLWMGVPTLTLPRGTVPSRGSSRSLEHIGLESFIAADKEDFVRKGVAWAGNLEELAGLRAQMRTLCMQSPMLKPDVVSVGLSRALRIMWQRWCDGKAPVAFEVPASTDEPHMEFPGQQEKLH